MLRDLSTAQPDPTTLAMIIGGLVGLWLVVQITLIPYYIARHRGVAGRWVMVLVLALFGWTGIGWFACLLWATLGDNREKRAFYVTAYRERTR